MTRDAKRFSARLLTQAFWLVLAGLTLLATPPARAEVTYPPGMRIGIEPPPAMKFNPAAGRFEDPDRKASITLIDLPLQNYSDIERMVFAETNKPGVTLLKRESFPFANGIGYYAAVRLTVDGVVWRKWLLLAAAAAAPMSDFAALVSFQVPESETATYTDEIARAALATVTFRPTPTEERLGLMPFVISDYAGFKLGDVVPNGVSLADENGGTGRIFISVGVGGPENVSDRPAFARELLRTVPLGNVRLISEEGMRIRGTPGYEIKAAGQSPNGGDLSFVQWVRFSGSGAYLMILAVATTPDWDQLYPRFRAVRDGLEPR